MVSWSLWSPRTLLHHGVRATRNRNVSSNRVRAQEGGVHPKEERDRRNHKINVLGRTLIKEIHP